MIMKIGECWKLDIKSQGVRDDKTGKLVKA